MPSLPVVSGKEAVRAFERLGYRQCEGRPRITIPMKNPVAKGALTSIIRDAGFTVEEFEAAL